MGRLSGTRFWQKGPEKREATYWLPFLRNFVEAMGGKVLLVETLREQVTIKLRNGTIPQHALKIMPPLSIGVCHSNGNHWNGV